MKLVAVISTGYLWFPCEKGTPRIFDFCMSLVDAGYMVDAYVPTFQHFEKAKRDFDKIKSQKYPINLIPIKNPGYKRNIGAKRIYSNKVLSYGIKKALAGQIDRYDCVFVSLPPNDVAKEAVKVCNKAGVPCIADVEDLWPEAMAMVLKNDSLREGLLRSFKDDAEFVYKNCDGVIGTSPDYTARAFKNQKREIPNKTVYVGCDIKKFDEGVEEFDVAVDKPEDEFWVTYAGSVSKSYDIDNIIDAADILYNTGHDKIKIKILGTGSELSRIQDLAEEKSIKSVEFLGFCEYKLMAAYLKKSDLLINSFVKGAPQSVVNKVGDYLAAGKPIINTLENPVFSDMVIKSRMGLNVEPGNPGALCSAVLELYRNEKKCADMGKRARSLCEKEFDRNLLNQEIIKMIETLKK